jgi:hypothetical protein
MLSVAVARLVFVAVGGPDATSWNVPKAAGRVTVAVKAPFAPTVADPRVKVWLFVSVRVTVDPGTKFAPVTVNGVALHGVVVTTDSVGAVT